MKAIKLFGTLLLVAAMAIGFTSCGDKDEPFGSSSSVTVNGNNFKVNRAYWFVREANENDVFYVIMLTSSDLNNPKDPLTTISIVYNVPGGSTDTFATGEFNAFDVSLSIVSNDDSKDRQFYGSSNEDGNNATLKITKDGGITVQFDGMNYKLEPTATEKFAGTAFSYTGSVSKLEQKQ